MEKAHRIKELLELKSNNNNNNHIQFFTPLKLCQKLLQNDTPVCVHSSKPVCYKTDSKAFVAIGFQNVKLSSLKNLIFCGIGKREKKNAFFTHWPE